MTSFRCIVAPAAAFAVLVIGCHSRSGKQHDAPPSQTKLSVRFDAPPFTEAEASRHRDLELAQYDYDRDPHDEQAIIWLGRRLAYVGRYNDAIDIFSNGIAIHPGSYRLLRHRGHRYLTVRMFGRAEADLSRAAELIESQQIADEVEPDGQPNSQNIPTSTSHTNIYYHLGLARYLQGDFAGAAQAYEKCMSFSKNDDMKVATAYWHYLALDRSAERANAQRVLDFVTSDMNIIENSSYHRLALMFKGERSPANLRDAGIDHQPPDIDDATIGYGLGMYELLRGDRERAHATFQAVVANTNRAAFGHIAAERELATHHPTFKAIEP